MHILLGQVYLNLYFLNIKKIVEYSTNTSNVLSNSKVFF